MPTILGHTLSFDRDFITKVATVVVTTAATAAFTAGLDKLVALLAADPRYAVWATVITVLVSAFSKKAA